VEDRLHLTRIRALQAEVGEQRNHAAILLAAPAFGNDRLQSEGANGPAPCREALEEQANPRRAT
jgi:hypothetical protein